MSIDSNLSTTASPNEQVAPWITIAIKLGCTKGVEYIISWQKTQLVFLIFNWKIALFLILALGLCDTN